MLFDGIVSGTFEEGVAMQLSLDKFATTSNTSIMNWCAARNEYTSDNFGSPDGENHLCTSNVPPPPFMSDTAEDTG